MHGDELQHVVHSNRIKENIKQQQQYIRLLKYPGITIRQV